MLMLIGSRALKIRAPQLLTREPKDVDFIASLSEVQLYLKASDVAFPQIYPINAGKKYIARGHKTEPIHEFEIAWTGTTAKRLLEAVQADPETVVLGETTGTAPDILVPSLDVLYALKRSHRFLKNSPHFLKTMRDIQAMAGAGAKVPEAYAELFKAREKETYDYGHPKLNQDKMGFFSGDGVQYVFDHDSIHQAVALGDRPAYQLYQKDGAEVACDRNKWDALPLSTKLAGVLEESYVLALERSQIPFKGTVDPRKSFEMALMKVCTSITSGWFRAFAWDHYDEVVAAYDPEYANKFWSAADAGRVKRMAA